MTPYQHACLVFEVAIAALDVAILINRADRRAGADDATRAANRARRRAASAAVRAAYDALRVAAYDALRVAA